MKLINFQKERNAETIHAETVLLKADEILQNFDWFSLEKNSDLVSVFDILFSNGENNLSQKDSYFVIQVIVEYFDEIMRQVKTEYKDVRKITDPWQVSINEII